MGAAATRIPIRHRHTVQAVETTQAEDARPQELTLLELVAAVGDVTDDEREVVATVKYMLSSGRVRLTGNFHDEPIELLTAG